MIFFFTLEPLKDHALFTLMTALLLPIHLTLVIDLVAYHFGVPGVFHTSSLPFPILESCGLSICLITF